MTDTTTITISIGRNIGSEPMIGWEWDAFRDGIRSALADLGATVYVDAAASVGEWDGIAEQSATWVAEIDADHVQYVPTYLTALCAQFNQDAIALTAGTTTLVGA